MKDESEIIGGALTGELSAWAYREIQENDIEPLDMVRALLTVAGNVGSPNLGIRRTARIFRDLAIALESRIPKPPERLN